MNMIYNENSRPETLCLAFDRLNISESISNQSFNSSIKSTETLFSTYLEVYFKLICQQLRQDKKNLFGSPNQVNLNALKIAYPVLLVFGILGNLVSFVVMLKMHKRKKKSNRFSINLAALALADLAVLIFGCFREYSDDILEWRIRSMNSFFCKLFYFECYLFSCFSAYLHAYISIERWYAVSNPIKSKISPFKNRKLILVLFLMCVLVSLPYIYVAQIKKLVSVNKENLIDVQIINVCEIIQESLLADLVLAVNDYIICCMIPFLFTFSFCSLTLSQLFKNKRMKFDAYLKEINENNNLDRNTNHSIKLSEREQIINSNSASNLKLTMMLMSLPICYLITNFPIFILLIAQFYNQKTNDYRLELVIAKVLMYTNNSINILFYIFLGKNFKKVLTDLIFKKISLKFNRINNS